jgi:two-component system, NarL family, invasion response regulator UvrY
VRRHHERVVKPLMGIEPRAGTVTVLLVDDQATFRAAARLVVERVKEFDLVAEATSGEQAVAMATEHRPDLVLMDINMGAMDGIEATRHITTARPQTMVILVSTYIIDDLPPTARRSGASAYLNKDELSPRVIRRLWESGGDDGWRVPRRD